MPHLWERIDYDLVLSFVAPLGLAYVIAKLISLTSPNSPFWAILAILYVLQLVGIVMFFRGAERRGEQYGKQVRQRYGQVIALDRTAASARALQLLSDESLFERTTASASGMQLPSQTPESVRELLGSTERIRGVDFVNIVLERGKVMCRDSGELEIGSWKSPEGDAWSITVNPKTEEALLYSDDEVVWTFPTIYHLIIMQAGE